MYSESESEGHYTYMQASSILESNKKEDHVSTLNTTAIDKQVLEYTSTSNPLAFYG